MNVNKWFDVLELVKNAKGKEKLEILKENKDVYELEQIVKFLYDPRVVTGISKKKWNKNEEVILEDGKSIKYIANEIMDYIYNHKTGKIQDLEELRDKLKYSFSQKEVKYLNDLIIKDTPYGVSANTINKVWPGLISVFKLQKGKKFEGTFSGEQSISYKLDGNSATVFNLKERTYILSRSGAEMLGLSHIIDFYRNNMKFDRVYQGELLLKNKNKLDHGELFQLTNGITNSKDKDKSQLQHVIFDTIDYNDFKNGKSDEIYSDRIKWASQSVFRYLPKGPLFDDVEVVEEIMVTDSFKKIEIETQLAKNAGMEGLMIIENSSTYKVGKQKWLQKIKEFDTMDLEVVDTVEHIRGERVGSLVVNYKGNKVSVGGIKKEQQLQWWIDENSIIGKIIEVKYFRETEDNKGNKSLRFPTFVRVRDDKIEINEE